MKKTYIVLFGLLLTISLPQNIVAAAALEDVDKQEETWEQEQLAQRQQKARAVMQNLTPEQKKLGKQLLKATQKCSAEEVKSLIDQGAPVNFRNNDGETALYLATFFYTRQLDENIIINALIAAGSDVTITSNKGWTPLINCACYRRIDLIKPLLKAGAGASIDQQTITYSPNSTALMYAIDNPDMTRLLLEANASVNIQNHDGYTALLQAIYNGYSKTIQLLIFAGSCLDIKNNKNETAWTIMPSSSSGMTRKEITLVIKEAIKEKDRSQNLPVNLKQQLLFPVPLIDLILDYEQDPILRTQQLAPQPQQTVKKIQTRTTQCTCTLQ